MQSISIGFTLLHGGGGLYDLRTGGGAQYFDYLNYRLYRDIILFYNCLTILYDGRQRSACRYSNLPGVGVRVF
jgi:hypothetical protein